ncbi:MAG: hypothetical protein ACTSRP_18015 [Candidatus Helarchaeota archaeon]
MSTLKYNKDLILEIEYLLAHRDLNKFLRLLKELKRRNINIPELFANVRNLEYKLSELIMASIQLNNIDYIFEILREINKFGVLNKITFNYKVKDLIKSEIQYKLFIKCVHELFGEPTEPFLIFIIKILPRYIIDEFNSNPILYFGGSIGIEDNIAILKDFLNGYTMYGLNIRKISDYRTFMENYDNKKQVSKIKGYYTLEITKNRELVSYSFDFFNNLSSLSEVHLINEDVLTKIRTKRDSNIYDFEFPIISMVIKGGLGPQGKGFAYLTPYNEICEICSDVKENKAYILEYKKYLKRKFLAELDEIIEKWEISDEKKSEIIEFLDANIQLNFIDSSSIEYVYEKIDRYFNKISGQNEKFKIDDQFRSKLKSEVQKILLKFKKFFYQ